jgi:hypothetical protein
MCRLATLLLSPAASFQALDANRAGLESAWQAELDSPASCDVDFNINEGGDGQRK